MNEWFQAEEHAERAHRFYEAGQWERALDEIQQALEVNPHQSEWHFGMGMTLDALSRYGEAVHSFEKVIELRGPDVDSLLSLSVNLIRTEQPRRAIDALKQAGELDPECEPSYCFRILACAQLGDHDAAEEMFYMARQLVDECPLCYDHMAQSLMARGLWDKAIWCWQQTLRLEPLFTDASIKLARAHRHRGQFARARDLYLDALRSEPGDVNVLIELGQLLMEMGRRVEAREKFRRALEQDPTSADAELSLGELALLEGHHDAARDHLDAARRMEPDLAGVHLSLGQLAFQKKQLDRARLYAWAELSRPHRGFADSMALAELFIELNVPAPVPRLLAPIINAPDDSVDEEVRANCLFLRGLSRLLSQRFDRGIADCRLALQLDPNHPLALENLALAYIETGSLSRARVFLQRAVALRPHDHHLNRIAVRLITARIKTRGRSIRHRIARLFGRR